jgi:hypothetical protein
MINNENQENREEEEEEEEPGLSYESNQQKGSNRKKPN